MTTLREAAQQALDILDSEFTSVDGEFCRWCDGRLNAKHNCSLEQTITALNIALAAPIIQPEIKDDKPFGYFRAEPFGWTDCAPTDEGAIPLYERPQQPPTPPEAKTEAEKVAYCAGWWAAMDAKREQNDKPQGNLLPWKGLTEEEHTYYKACGFVGVKAVEEKLRARNSMLDCHQGEEGK